MRRPLPVAAIVAILSASHAAALDLPARKPGLWDIKMTFEAPQRPPRTSRHCIDAETDKLMNSIGGGLRQETCSKQDVQRVGDTIMVDSVCTVGAATITSHGVITGDFNSAYTVKVTSTREGGSAKPGRPESGTTNMTIDATWTGACKADQKPGDIIMADGRKINIRDLQNRRPPKK